MKVTRTDDNQRKHLWILLVLIVFTGCAIRLAAWAYWKTGSIESEGAEYTRIAENLRHGVGYVGLVTNGPELLFNPLFPWMIALTSFVTPTYELAGRVVALLMGSLLPLPVLGIASRIFNRRVGVIAALLAVLHPLLIHLSFTVFSEGPYTTLFLTSTYLVVRALDRPSLKLWLFVGTAFGFAWLLRAEATAALALAALFAIFGTSGTFGSRTKRAAAAVLMFLVVASPEVVLIYRSTGKLKLEGKSTIFFYTGERILAAERYPGVEYNSPGGHRETPTPTANAESAEAWQSKWAFYGIDNNAHGMGFPMRPHAEVIKETSTNLKDVVLLFARGLRMNAPVLFQRLSSDWLGAPLLPALALLGAFRRPWRGSQATTRLFVLTVAAAPVFATFFAFWSEQRYYVILVPFLCIWAANGLLEIARWAEASSIATRFNWASRPMISQWLIPGLLGLVMVISSINGVRRMYIFVDSALPSHVDKDLGMWIGQQQNYAVRVMDTSIPLAYHAGAQFSYFPYCSGDLAIRYLDVAQVDYLVLRRGEQFTRYYDDWLGTSVPDQRAERLNLPSGELQQKFVVFRWHRDNKLNGSAVSQRQTQ